MCIRDRIATNGGASFVILVMIVAAIITGLFASMPVGTIFDSMMEGCGKMMWLFFMFLIFNPFLNFVTQSGAFDALLQLLEPLIGPTGKVGFTLLTVLVGIFGINGAAVEMCIRDRGNILIAHLPAEAVEPLHSDHIHDLIGGDVVAEYDHQLGQIPQGRGVIGAQLTQDAGPAHPVACLLYTSRCV